MKKIITLLLSTSFLLATAGCGSNDIETRLESLEKRVSILEGNKTSTQSTTNTSKQESSDNQNNAKLNVLSFELESTDTSSDSFVIHQYKVNNNGDSPIEYISIDIAYYDSNGNCIDTDGRFKDVLLEPGKFVTVKSYGGDETTKNNIASSKVISYYYYLVEPNENGNNKISVDCETGKIKESFIEK